MKFIKTLPLAIVLIATGCSDNESNPPDEPEVPVIVGSWEHTDVIAGNCITTLNFSEDLIFTESSLDERQEGTYTFDDTTFLFEGEVNVFDLVITVDVDNGLSACDDSVEDETGESLPLNVGFPDNNSMDWYRNGEVDLSFDRVLED